MSSTKANKPQSITQHLTGMPAWVDAWAGMARKTGETDWANYEAGVDRLYELAGLSKVPLIRVASPLVGAIVSYLTHTKSGGNLDAAIPKQQAITDELGNGLGKRNIALLNHHIARRVNLATGFLRRGLSAAFWVGGEGIDYFPLANELGLLNTIWEKCQQTPDWRMPVKKLEYSPHHIQHTIAINHHPLHLGQFDPVQTARNLYAIAILKAKPPEVFGERIKAMAQIVQSGGVLWLKRHYAILCARPISLHLDDSGRPHNPGGMAYEWEDSFGLYNWKGMPIAKRIITNPETITSKEIDNCPNVEIRRVLMERYGFGRYLLDGGAVIRHQDDWGTLYVKPAARLSQEEPLVMVEVVNSTPEPDGSGFKNYLLRVDPQLRPMLPNGSFGAPQEMTAKNAIASTFGRRGEDYGPKKET